VLNAVTNNTLLSIALHPIVHSALHTDDDDDDDDPLFYIMLYPTIQSALYSRK